MQGRHRLLRVVAVCALLLAGGVSASAQGTDFTDPGATAPDAIVYAPVFADVPEGHPFESAIRALLASGITAGCNDVSTEFCPDHPVTRGQMAAFLTRALPLPDDEGNDFIDDNDSTFENAIQRLSAAGITKGCNPPDNNRYCPDHPVTRGQMAAFLTRALPLVVPPALPPGVLVRREPAQAAGVGTSLTVCRDIEISLMVRSVTAGSGLHGVTAWVPTTFETPVGEVNLPTDRWYLPAGLGCETLELAWDPRANDLTAPLDTLRVGSPFGPRVHPILGGLRPHEGTDFEAKAGDPVYASAPGVVVFAGTRGGYGGLVDIRHPGGLNTRYGHLSSIDVTAGAPIQSGAVLGAVGCTGLCTGPHLHFETREFDVAVDPMTYLVEDS